MSQIQEVHDGVFLRPVATGAPRFVFPFRQNGDRVSCYFEQDYWQDISTYVPQNFGIPSDDPAYPTFYLVFESEPVQFLGSVYKFTRIYSRIPTTQVVYSTMALTKPSIPNQATGTVGFSVQGASGDVPIGIGAGSYYANYLFSPANMFYGPLLTGAPTVTFPSGGQFTINYRGQVTGNLNWNDADVTIAAAINALSTVISDGLTVTISNALGGDGQLGITMAVGATTFRFVMNSAGLTPGAATTTFTFIQNSSFQSVVVAYRVAIASHGLSGTLPLIVALATVGTTGGTVVAMNPRLTSLGSGQWEVIDANTIAVTSASALYPSSSYTKFGNYLRTYVPGPDRVKIKLVSDFYLPGITAGITTAADIPVPAPLINDTDFIQAVLTNPSGYLTYDSSALIQWNGWSIYTQTQTQINMADV